MVRFNKYIVPRGYVGITLYPFIILKNKQLSTNKILLNHEKIHLQQQLQLLIIGFYIIYGLEFLVRLLVKRHWKQAYLNISFEREAYDNETNLNYLKQRPFWNFIHYF